MEQQRLRSNAFYQQEAARRNATPMGLHPALRPLAQEETSSPLDALSKYATDRFENERASQVTTMTPFLNSGTERVTVTAPHHSSPELKLVPHGREKALPTTRGFIEEQREHTAWNASGRADERTPVFQYTPKPPSGFESESEQSHAVP
ncbi:hypothetical protein M8818_005688 [Zalaria obscura]|uniref:Uncharacterized protein n=1 Tax=Zalaria obscura TaxID=2024903 RepID=A0ACC3S999_9PEZI